MIKHLFFDLDRTLWDFERNSKIALSILYQNFELNRYFEHYLQFEKVYENVNAELWRAYGKRKISKLELRDNRFYNTLLKVDVEDRLLGTELSEAYLKISPFQTALLPNAIETLESLKKSNYELHIITNGFEEVQHIKLRESKIDHYFEHIICSETVGINKPDPRVFSHALDLAKATKLESVMIGDDREVDVEGANQFGMRSILFDPNERHRVFRDQVKVKDLKEIPLKLIFMK